MRAFHNRVGAALPGPGQVRKHQVGRDNAELAGAAVEDERNLQAVNLVLLDGAIERSADKAETDNANALHVCNSGAFPKQNQPILANTSPRARLRPASSPPPK